MGGSAFSCCPHCGRSVWVALFSLVHIAAEQCLPSVTCSHQEPIRRYRVGRMVPLVLRWPPPSICFMGGLARALALPYHRFPLGGIYKMPY